jgi:diaminohydroxyphosphoribosylaminopyrimidine deaminase/5-amino-6-(5-phosphoribosylamino)uracil reductase
MRLILDNSLQTDPGTIVATTTDVAPTVVFTNSGDHAKIDHLRQKGVKVMTSEMGGRDLDFVLESLKELDIQSVLVEGGSEIAGAFCDARLVDKVTLFTAPFIIGGRSAPVAIGGIGADSLSSVLRLADVSVETLGTDIVVTGYPAG